jgi:hypothetical protein
LPRGSRKAELLRGGALAFQLKTENIYANNAITGIDLILPLSLLKRGDYRPIIITPRFHE